MNFSSYVRTLGRGPGRSRALTQEEAQDAMRQILAGTPAPEAVGALLMLLRYRGESAAEIAGFVEAVRADHAPWSGVRPALDWPTYAAGRTRGVAWFLLAARLVAGAGYPVLLHGWNSHQNPLASVRAALPAAAIPEASSIEQASTLLQSHNIAYLPLELFAPKVLELLKLRDVLGLRSAMNTVCRMLNPGLAPASVQGVFHPSYRELQADAGALLGQSALSVIKGGGGEFERHPSKEIAVFGLRQGAPWQDQGQPLSGEARRLGDGDYQVADLDRLWSGDLQDEFALAVVTGTAALALHSLGAADSVSAAGELANTLWGDRNKTGAV